ncbi:glycoside hydrolase family 19 protein [Sodalis ligni]|uniref:glycoside hydrolase family 19 protein n=1 Tax=Sodalis ligni TaxID=2697027 RepID=UPI00193FDBCA|nr:glycoside hydrolase family 19 protein [Sodalis ligni]QWA09541.1 glycoside hydrolase family 19 protein [Sodalis ligni]
MTSDQFQQAANLSAGLAARWFQPLTDAMVEFGIDTALRQAAFIAQIGTESGGFSQLSESFNYSIAGLAIFGTRLTDAQRATLGRQPGEKTVPLERQQQIANIVYGGRYGNTHDGDGWLYRGRGLKQVTFYDNYFECAAALDVDVVGDPDLLLQDVNAARSAGWFWQANKCNGYADIGDMIGLTRRINGGLNGLPDRQARYQIARKALL